MSVWLGVGGRGRIGKGGVAVGLGQTVHRGGEGGQHGGGRAVLHDAAALEPEDAVGGGEAGRIMGDGDQALGQGGKVAGQADLAGQVKPGEGLVQKDGAGLHEQHRLQAEPVPLALAERGGGGLGPMGAALGRQQGARGGPCFGLGPALLAQTEGQFLDHRGKEDLVIGVLEQDAEAPERCLAVTEGVDAAKRQLARRGRDQPGEQAQERGLARSVAPEDADARFGQGQGKAGQDRATAESDGDIGQMEAGYGGRQLHARGLAQAKGPFQLERPPLHLGKRYPIGAGHPAIRPDGRRRRPLRGYPSPR